MMNIVILIKKTSLFYILHAKVILKNKIKHKEKTRKNYIDKF